jgi:hypothetical protein
MQPDLKPQSSQDSLQSGAVPTMVSALQPPAIGPLPPVAPGTPPLLPAEPACKSGFGRQVLSFLLSLYLGLFLTDAVVSLVDDSLILLFDIRVFTAVRGVVFCFSLLLTVVVYGLMGLTPMIPKRWFLPVALFNPLTALAVIPFAIYFYSRLQPISGVISLCQLIFGLGILYWVQGGFKLHWPLVAVGRLKLQGFSWLNLSGFLALNLLVGLPAAVVYLAVCAALAVGHFSEGFLALRPGGLTVQVRSYVRNDGKTIRLVPMAHIGEADFYQQLSQSFPTNAVVLMEGVTDKGNLLTNRITYQRMATSLGLSEQHEEFHPVRAKLVMADVDVEQFAPTTIGFLNLVMLIHAKGLNVENLLRMLQFSPPPHFEEQLFDDLLRKRNRHLLDELQARLSQPEQIIVPWGVAHMPGIAEGIQASGFRLDETHQYTVIRFRFAGPKAKTPPSSNRRQNPPT